MVVFSAHQVRYQLCFTIINLIVISLNALESIRLVFTKETFRSSKQAKVELVSRGDLPISQVEKKPCRFSQRQAICISIKSVSFKGLVTIPYDASRMTRDIRLRILNNFYNYSHQSKPYHSAARQF